MRTEIIAALIGAGATLVAAAAGFGVVFWQIGRQARNSLKQNREIEITKLKLKLYEEITQVASDASSAVSEFNVYIRLMMVQLSTYEEGVTAVPSSRFPELQSLEKAASKTSSKLHLLVEQWLKIEPKIGIFGLAFSAAWYDLREAYSKRLVQLVIPVLPVEINGEIARWRAPTQESINQIELAVNDVGDAAITLQAYIFDFKVEMQDLLLNDLFDNNLEKRVPADKEYKTIRIDNYDNLKKYFYNETEWGKYHSASLDRVKRDD